MTHDTLSALANVAASAMLTGVFLSFLLLTVLAYLAARGLREARRQSPDQLARAARLARDASVQVRETSLSVVRPQVRLASTWAGIRAAVRAIARSDGPAGPQSSGDEERSGS